MTLLMKRLMKKTTAPQRGFTLIEMVIVLAIISLLMLIVVPNLNDQRQHAADHQKEALTEVVQNQAEIYTNDTNNEATIDAMRKDGYLNEKQADQAKKQGIDPIRPTKPKA